MPEPVFELFDTPHPREAGFKVPVKVDVYKPALVPAVGDAYRAAKGIDKIYAKDFGAFVFSHLSMGPPGWIYYNYLRPISGEPEAYEEFPYQDDSFYWPDILEEFKIFCDNPNPRWVLMRDNLQEYFFVVRKRVRPSFKGVTNITVRR
jgi:hypothetical protein